jgi:single-stranded DNA-binding protein
MNALVITAQGGIHSTPLSRVDSENRRYVTWITHCAPESKRGAPRLLSCIAFDGDIVDAVLECRAGNLVRVSGSGELRTYKDRTGTDRWVMRCRVDTFERIAQPDWKPRDER